MLQQVNHCLHHRNDGTDDDDALAEFQYLALISHETTDVLDQTSFIFT